MRFIITGTPIHKKRPRFMRRGAHVITFDPQDKEKQEVRGQFMEQYGSAVRHEDKQIVIEASSLALAASFECSMEFHIRMPESWPEWQKNEKLWALTDCDCKPDLDNLEKFYLDCMNGIIYEDDKQIVKLQSKKVYSKEPKTIIDIMARKELSISSQAKGILQIFGPNELMEFALDVADLYWIYEENKEDEERLDKELGGNHREIRLQSIALILSKVADKHAKAFKKINSRYPDFWKECHRIPTSMEEADVLEDPGEKSGSTLHQEADDGVRGFTELHTSSAQC